MPLQVRPLPPELAEKARVELFEDPKKLEDGIAHLKDWIAKQPHLRARTDDQWLATFLRGSKFSIERAKEKIDLYYTMRTLAPELNTLKPSDPKFMEILKLGQFLVLPKTEKLTDPRLFIFCLNFDITKYTMLDMMAVPNVLQQIMFIEDDQFVVNGALSVMDMKGGTLAHLTSISPSLIKKMSVAGQDAAPVRMKGVHYLNVMPAFETIFNIFKTFMNEKNRKRLYVHGKDMNSFHQIIPRELLPVEYGGTGGVTVQEIVDYWVKKVEEYSEWLSEEETFGTDEARRPGRPRTAESMFGVDGSFRQLEFD